jgi:hypothetical protein
VAAKRTACRNRDDLARSRLPLIRWPPCLKGAVSPALRNGGGTKLGFLSHRGPPVLGQPVIPAEPAVVCFLPVGLDQSLGSQPFQHPVQAADL